ncbi:DUF305 domain-containing protein [Nocardia noduli]|uniref:DUF305 domain-containing protein n=1 Tax=Nocardia noduli TaxID=2815722 RepID=UPI001C24A2A3|nr:DUF305 domain-containing protein [Nocardia noduli]
MTRADWVKGAALTSFAVLLLVVGAALGPLVLSDDTAAPPVMSDTEIGFTQDMVAHHNQALSMTQRLDRAADPTVRALAQQLADTQRLELGMMLGWLRMARVVTTNPHPMAWMHDDTGPDKSAHPGHAHGGAATSAAAQTPAPTTMPGMATQEELDALSAARGADAEILFLRLMQRHHYGGIQMAQAAERQLSSGIVKQAARDMLDTQSRESGLLGLLLDQRTAATP